MLNTVCCQARWNLWLWLGQLPAATLAGSQPVVSSAQSHGLKGAELQRTYVCVNEYLSLYTFKILLIYFVYIICEAKQVFYLKIPTSNTLFTDNVVNQCAIQYESCSTHSRKGLWRNG
jgi:hypothetical protein